MDKQTSDLYAKKHGFNNSDITGEDDGLSNTEESNAKCYICGQGLSIIETLIYGNRCVFCWEDKFFPRDYLQHKEIPLLLFLRLCYWDWKIYQETMKMKYGLHYIRRDNGEKVDLTGLEMFKAILGNLGYEDINQVNTVARKKVLWKRLRRPVIK